MEERAQKVPRRVAVEINQQDLEAYWDYFLLTPKGEQYTRSNMIIQQGVMLIVVLLLFLLLQVSTLSLADSLPFALFILLLAEFIYFWKAGLHPRRYYAKRALQSLYQKLSEREKGFAFMPREFIITPEELTISSTESEHRWKWRVIDNIVRTNEHIFIEVTSTMYFIIPKRSFATNAEFETFWEEMESFFSNSRSEEKAVVPAKKIKAGPQRAGKKAKILFLLLFVLLCCGLVVGVNTFFDKMTTIMPPSSDIKDVLNGYMNAMAQRNVNQALSYFYKPSQETLDWLNRQLEAENYALYTGYQRVELNFSSVDYAETARAEVEATIFYDEGEGLLLAQLKTLNGEWKIVSIRVYVSPSKVKQFLQP